MLSELPHAQPRGDMLAICYSMAMRLSPPRLALLALTLTATIPAAGTRAALHSQELPEAPHRTSRSKIFAVVGGLVGGALGVVFAKSSGSGGSGSCLGVQCVIVAGTAGGALLGFFVGREFDERYERRYHGVAPLHIESFSSELEGEPVALALGDSMVAVAGSAGVQLFGTSASLLAQPRRAGGLRGISVVALAPASGWIALGSPSGLYLFPPGGGPGALVRGGSISAAAATDARVFFGVDVRLEAAPLETDTTRVWPGISLGASGEARDLAIDSARSTLWVVTARNLESYAIAGDSLISLGSAPLAGAGRRLALAHDTIAVAMGEAGVRLFDASDPGAPRPIANWSVARFVYDVSIDAGRLFAAAGPEGVYVIDLRSGTMQTIGLARELGFAAALASREGHTYILDRRSNSLRRIVSDF